MPKDKTHLRYSTNFGIQRKCVNIVGLPAIRIIAPWRGLRYLKNGQVNFYPLQSTTLLTQKKCVRNYKKVDNTNESLYSN